MAELLIRAKSSSNPSATEVGDIIVVRSDGWEWGRCECPPEYIIVKLPNIKEADIKYYEDSLMDNTDPKNPIMLKRAKYAVDTTIVNTCISEISGKKEISKATFDSKLITKAK